MRKVVTRQDAVGAVLERARLLDGPVEIPEAGTASTSRTALWTKVPLRSSGSDGRWGAGVLYIKARNLETVRTLTGFRSVASFDEVAAYCATRSKDR